MCGIFTAVNIDHQAINLAPIMSVVKNRGPDDIGCISWEAENFEYLSMASTLSGELLQGHVRLAVIDLSEAGKQPMISPCGRYSICYNGEVYNYVEIRNALVGEGVKFESDSDTEVIMQAIICWGIDAINQFRGMFSFSFYDSVDRELLVARDHFGIKPLYYARSENNFYLASEISQLLLCKGVSSSYEPQMVYEYLLSGASDHTADTMYKQVKQFPAGHYARFSIDDLLDIDIQPYWELDLRNKVHDTFPVAAEKVRSLFLDSVKLHMRSDVKLGAALSGGIDSSAIVCAMRYLYPQQDIHTFSFIAESDDISEEHWIDIVNDFVGAQSHKIKASEDELLSDLTDLIKTQGEPFGSTSIYAQYRVFREAREAGVTVMLDGQGADEMLAGYIFYQGTKLAGLLRRGKFITATKFFLACIRNTSSTFLYLLQITVRELLSARLARTIKGLILPNKRTHWLSETWLLKESVSDAKVFKRAVNWKNPLKTHLKSTLTEVGLPNLLRYEDRDSMRWSIESRVPFLHVELVEYLYSLPDEYLLSHQGVSKHVFREAMRGIVPDAILDRKDKIGFATPERDWLLKAGSWVDLKLTEAECLPFFNVPELKKEWGRVVSGEVSFDFRCWRWLNLISWASKKDE